MTSLDQIDREIDTQTAELSSLSAALVELDSHDGLEHVRRYPPTGVTAQRWDALRPAVYQMWEDLRRMSSILDAVRAVRAGDSGRTEVQVVELSRLLHQRPLAVTQDGISLASSAGGDLGGAVEFVGLADSARRIRTAFPAVIDFLCAVAEISSQVAKELAPLINQLDALGVAMPEQITDLLAVSASDPLSLTADDVRTRVDQIAEGIDRRSAEFAEDAAMQSDWPAALAVTAATLDNLQDAVNSAADARRRAESRVVTSPLPVPGDDVGALRNRLRSFVDPDPAGLRALRGLIAAALRKAHDNEVLAVGLLDRRAELKGRLSAYEAKAARLGIAEDREVLAAGSFAEGLLAHRPCDLRAATRAVTDYQEIVARKRGLT